MRVIGDVKDAPTELGDAYRMEAKIVIWSAPSTLKVPVSTLVRKDGGWSVCTVDGGRAHAAPVKIEQRGRTEAEVLEGMAEGVAVVVHPWSELAENVGFVVE